ncbi:MAG: PKD domain-containing protein [Bacteroidota bacterium]
MLHLKKNIPITVLHFMCLLMILVERSSAQIAFTENKGQWNEQVMLQADIGGQAFFLTQDGYVVRMQNKEDLEYLAAYYHGHAHDSIDNLTLAKRKTAPVLRSHAYRVRLIGANKNLRILKEKPTSGYENYYIGNDPSRWASGCRSYQSVTYKDIYPAIDLRYYLEGESLKYDFIIHPGGRVENIRLHYEGADKLALENKSMHVYTSAGDMLEKAPFTYQFQSGIRNTVICKYRLKGNYLSFDLGNYDPASTLIIDPSLVFSSFSRSARDNWGFTATPGPDGSMFGAGIAAPTGFPITLGAYQTQGGGPDSNNPPPPDIAIIKLSPNGRDLLYATYLGGTNIEQPHSLVTDAQGNLIVAGRTNSGNSFPGTLFGPGGNYDIFVTKFNADGTALIGSIKIGGTQNDGVNTTVNRFSGPAPLLRNYGDDGRSEVIVDRNNNILLAACTQSDDFFVRNGFQSIYGGNQDGVIVKLNPTSTGVIWSSYLGGSEEDAAFVLSPNPLNGDIYVAGGTGSANFPQINVASLQSVYNGGIADGYISQLKDNGTTVTLNRSSFMGTDQTDIVYGVQFDRGGFPYVMGTSTGAWPVTNAAYVNANARQFIAKLQPDLSAFIYSTTFGTPGALSPNISPVAFLVDNCENVYVSGWGGAANSFSSPPYPTSGTSGMPITPDAFQSQTDGSDFYFFVLKRNASDILYGSYFGQRGGNGGVDHVDGGTSRFDAKGVIYQAVCANCKFVPSGQPLQASYPITAGVFGNVNPASDGGGCNLGMAKILFDFTGVDVDLKPIGARQLNFCLPATVEFIDTVNTAKQFIWVWGDGSKNDTTTGNIRRHTYTTAGFFNVTLIGIDPNTCNLRDTASIRIRVTTDSVALKFDAIRRPPCTSLTFDFFNRTDKLSSIPNFGPRSFVWKWGDGSKNDTVPGFAPNPASHTFPGPGSYNVRLILIDTAFCNAGDSISILNFQVASTIRAGFTVSNGCVPLRPVIRDTSLGAATYDWVTSDGQRSALAQPNFIFNTPGTYTIKQIIFNNNSCNLKDSTERTLIVFTPPTAGFTYNPFPSKENEPTRFTSTASADVVKWDWDFGDGSRSDQKDPTHQFNATGFYNVCQIVTNANGCVDTLCQSVEAIIATLQDLPNAFTPNGDGINDIFLVRGFGITKMTLRIFNRQGLLVFESKSQNIGWDGTYNGTPQPMDAYAWTLDVEYFTGEKFRKKGDVTLIR